MPVHGQYRPLSLSLLSSPLFCYVPLPSVCLVPFFFPCRPATPVFSSGSVPSRRVCVMFRSAPFPYAVLRSVPPRLCCVLLFVVPSRMFFVVSPRRPVVSQNIH